jgi:hypothetical protein
MLVHVVFGLPYRQIEGFLRKLSNFVPQIKPADYATIWRRGSKLDIRLADINESVRERHMTALRIYLLSEPSFYLQWIPLQHVPAFAKAESK